MRAVCLRRIAFAGEVGHHGLLGEAVRRTRICGTSKEDAPSEISGEFSAIPTSVPGVRICEYAPKIAASFEKFAALRSRSSAAGQHSSFQCESGHSERNQPMKRLVASLGAVLSHVQGASKPGVPPSLALSGSRAEGGFLGTHRPFEPNGKGKSDMTLRGVTTDRLDDRKGLLASFDQFRREVDGSGMMDGMDAFNRQAFDVITSSDRRCAPVGKRAVKIRIATSATPSSTARKIPSARS
ncbi:MAG: hypothetical protein R3F11_14630 [Verrucomicrobiales bacterium]